MRIIRDLPHAQWDHFVEALRTLSLGIIHVRIFGLLPRWIISSRENYLYLLCFIREIVWRWEGFKTYANKQKNLEISSCLWLNELINVHLSIDGLKIKYGGMKINAIDMSVNTIREKQTNHPKINICAKCVKEMALCVFWYKLPSKQLISRWSPLRVRSPY